MALPATTNLEDEMTQLLEKDDPSPKCWERHRCTLLTGAFFILLGAVWLVHLAMMPRTLVLLSEKPLSDERRYQFSTLPNGLHMLNIQDAQSHKMAMAMGVRAGSYDDPRELPGLAHFCEHMLFLGTQKYPEPSGFDNFLTKYGGSSNAFTSSEATVYFAAASAEAAPEGLDRFADFFRAPLFQKEFVKKEVQAINSEHEKNVQSNVRRIFELLETQANPASVVGRFATGNMETLYEGPKRNGTSPVDALKVYFKERYCPEQMRLVTFGPQSLSEQVHLVTKAGFQALPSGAASCASDPRRFVEPNPFPSSRMGQSLLVQGTEATGSLWLHFQLPSLDREYRAQPLTYLNYVVNYGGEDSLKRILSDELGLISNVQMEEQTDSTGTMCMVVFETTDLGAKKPQAILDVFFAYLASMRSRGVDMELYKSLQDMEKLQWDWKQEEDAFGTVSNLAEVMTRLPHEKLLSGDSLIEKPDPELLKTILDLVRPTNMNIALVEPSGVGDQPLKASGKKIRQLEYHGASFVQDSVEKVFPHLTAWSSWMGMEKSQVTAELKDYLNAENLAGLSNDVRLPPRLPSKIEGIPEQVPLDYMKPPASLRMRGTEASATEKLFGPLPVRLSLKLPSNQSMVMVQTTGKEDVWFRSGWTMRDPKVHVAVGLRKMQAKLQPEATALDSVRLRIYEKLLNEVMAPKLYDLTVAGSTYAVSLGNGGMTLDFVGFQGALPTLIDKALDSFNSFNQGLNATKRSRFERIKNTYMEELQTFGGMPSSYAIQDLDRLLSRNSFSNDESLAAVKGLSLDAAVRTAGELVLSKPLSMTALAIGNLADLQSTEVLSQIVSSVQRPSWVSPKPVPKNATVEEVMPVVNIKRPIEVRAANPRHGDPNDVAVVSLIHGVTDVPSRVILGIASALLGTAAFDNLRTQQQLGYVVGGGMSTISNVNLVRVVVQGTKVNADEAEAAIEGLLTSTMPKILRDLSVDDFKGQVDAYRQQLLEPPLAASDEVTHFWAHITQGGRCMDLLDQVLQFLDSPACSKQLLLDTWNNLVFGKSDKGDKSMLRKKISVKYFASKGDEAPTRLSLEQAQKLWQKHGVAPDGMKILAEEFGDTRLVSKSNSKVRQELIKEGGYFPTDLNCGSSTGGSKASEETVMRKALITSSSGGEPLLHTQKSGKSFRRVASA